MESENRTYALRVQVQNSWIVLTAVGDDSTDDVDTRTSLPCYKHQRMLLFPGFVSLSDSFSSFVDLIRGSSHSLSPELSTYIKIRRQLAAPRALRTEFDEKESIKQNVKLLAIPESKYKASRQKKKSNWSMTNTGPKPFFSDIYRSTKEGRNRKKNAFHAWFPTAEQPSTISGFPKFSSPLRFSFFFLSQVGMSFEPELEEPVRNTRNIKGFF